MESFADGLEQMVYSAVLCSLRPKRLEGMKANQLYAVLATLALVAALPGCGTNGPGTAQKCTSVSAPVISVKPKSDDEPRVWVPQPPGWKQLDIGDVPPTRLVESKKSKRADAASATAVVKIKTVAGGGNTGQVLDQARSELTAEAGAFDVSLVQASVCGLQAQTVSYKYLRARPGYLMRRKPLNPKRPSLSLNPSAIRRT